MKELKLSLQNIEGAEVLTRQQLKMVMGGSGGGSGDGGTCGVNYYDYGGVRYDAERGMSKSAAIAAAASWNANHQSTCGCGAVAKWCCDSCD